MPNDPQTEEPSSGLAPEQPQAPNKLNKNQKMAAAGLGVFAFLVVMLWFVQLKNNIYAPFNSSATAPGGTEADSQTASDLALKNKDTDADGLSDYDELNLYKTSPYLDDSDSDGLKDGEEVKNGTDPNCPRGRTCLASSSLNAAASTSAANGDILGNILNQYNAVNQATGPAAGGGADNLNSEQIDILKNIGADSLRQMLLDAGMDKETLDQISDAELMQSYRETLNSQTGQ